MQELEVLKTKEDKSMVYKPVTLTVKVVSNKDTKDGTMRGFLFEERPNEDEQSEWWNASAFICKREPEFFDVENGDSVTVTLIHDPKIARQTGEHIKKANGEPDFWNNIENITINNKQTEKQTEKQETESGSTEPTHVTARIDSFPKNLDYNVDRDNKIILQSTLKSQVELTGALLSANSDISGIISDFDIMVTKNIQRAESMVKEIWNNRTKIKDWEIPE